MGHMNLDARRDRGQMGEQTEPHVSDKVWIASATGLLGEIPKGVLRRTRHIEAFYLHLRGHRNEQEDHPGVMPEKDVLKSSLRASIYPQPVVFRE